jgi:hypothetical protein
MVYETQQVIMWHDTVSRDAVTQKYVTVLD